MFYVLMALLKFSCFYYMYLFRYIFPPKKTNRDFLAIIRKKGKNMESTNCLSVVKKMKDYYGVIHAFDDKFECELDEFDQNKPKEPTRPTDTTNKLNHLGKLTTLFMILGILFLLAAFGVFLFEQWILFCVMMVCDTISFVFFGLFLHKDCEKEKEDYKVLLKKYEEDYKEYELNISKFNGDREKLIQELHNQKWYVSKIEVENELNQLFEDCNIPEMYRNEEQMSLILGIFDSGRAETFKEAYNVLAQDAHNRAMLDLQETQAFYARDTADFARDAARYAQQSAEANRRTADETAKQTEILENSQRK